MTDDTALPPSNDDQKASPSYQLPALDGDFLLGDSMRGVRFLLEYQKAEEMLRAWGVATTVVVFGSARILAGSPWYEEARIFGHLVSERGGAKLNNGDMRQNVIATGGGPGIMEAANRGAFEAGAPSIGFNITLPHEQEPNPYSTPALTFRFHYFAMRKMHLAMRANALIAFPGGFGTFDELFEILTLRQTGKMPNIPVALVGRAFWTKVINFEALADFGVIHRDDLKLFTITDTAEETWAAITSHGLKSKLDWEHVVRGDR